LIAGFYVMAGNNTKHGLIKHPLYRKWSDMKKRCNNPNVDRYKSYGALGIKVCDEWNKSFKSFYDWSISNGWEKGLTIERKNVNKDYCPENCCYIPLSEQKYNLRNTLWVVYKGIKIPFRKISNENNLEIDFRTVWIGLKNGKKIEYYSEKYPNIRKALDNYLVMHYAKNFIDFLNSGHVKFEKLNSTQDGGIMIKFENIKGYYSSVEIFNDGDVVFLIKGTETKAWDFKHEDFIQKISASYSV